MATEGDSDSGTDETFYHLCSVCKGKNKNTEADKFCSDCNDYYCSRCVKFHADIPALKQHKILDITDCHLESRANSLKVPTERCKEHKHKHVDMYCKTHEVVGCSDCMLSEHRKCKDKFYVPDFIKNSNNMPNLTDITEKLDTIANHVRVLQKTLITEKEKLNMSKENLLKQIQTFRKEINQRLDELEKSTIHELDRRFQSLHDKIESDLKDLQAAETDVMAAQNSLESTGGNKAQTFVSVKTAQADAAHAENKSDTMKSQLSSTEMSFVANQMLKFLLSYIQVLGNITQTDRSPSHDFVQQVDNSQNSHKTDERQSTSSLLQIKGSKKYNMKVMSDKFTCSIFSVCILEDGTIILSDSNNRKLKRVNPSSFIVRDYCDVPDDPHQLCAISNTEVAVCCYSQIIQFVSVGRTMKNTRQINTGVWCYGLAYCGGKLFVSGEKSVYVYTVSGEKLQQFCLDELGQSRLAVSSDNLNIFVASKINGLVIIDRNGSSIGGFYGPELQKAYDIYLHNSGNVLVCGYGSKNILQFSPDGKMIGQVLKTDNNCQALCCAKNNSELIVGFCNDEIEVYEISEL